MLPDQIPLGGEPVRKILPVSTHASKSSPAFANVGSTTEILTVSEFTQPLPSVKL